MPIAEDHLSSPDYQEKKAKARQKFIEGFYSWLERADAEKVNASAVGSLNVLANAKKTDKLIVRPTLNPSLVSDLVRLCISYLRSQLRAYALMLGESELPPEEAREHLHNYVQETPAETYERKWRFGLRQLAPLRSLPPTPDNLWGIVKEAVQDLVREDLNFDIDDGRTLARRRRSVGVIDKRRDLVAAFKARMVESGYKVKDEYIWRAVGQRQKRQFYYWKSGEDRKPKETRGATITDNQNFPRVLAMNPPEFVKLLASFKVSIPKK